MAMGYPVPAPPRLCWQCFRVRGTQTASSCRGLRRRESICTLVVRVQHIERWGGKCKRLMRSQVRCGLLWVRTSTWLWSSHCVCYMCGQAQDTSIDTSSDTSTYKHKCQLLTSSGNGPLFARPAGKVQTRHPFFLGIRTLERPPTHCPEKKKAGREKETKPSKQASHVRTGRTVLAQSESTYRHPSTIMYRCQYTEHCKYR
jgi:hypothetical protein